MAKLQLPSWLQQPNDPALQELRRKLESVGSDPLRQPLRPVPPREGERRQMSIRKVR